MRKKCGSVSSCVYIKVQNVLAEHNETLSAIGSASTFWYYIKYIFKSHRTGIWISCGSDEQFSKTEEILWFWKKALRSEENSFYYIYGLTSCSCVSSTGWVFRILSIQMLFLSKEKVPPLVRPTCDSCIENRDQKPPSTIKDNLSSCKRFELLS